MDISLIEWIVYGLVGYTGVILLIISAFRETPTGKSQSIVRVIYLALSFIALLILAGSGTEIQMETTITNSTLTSNNTTEIWTENVTHTSTFTLQNSIWISFHYLLSLVILVYMLLQILSLFMKV